MYSLLFLSHPVGLVWPKKWPHFLFLNNVVTNKPIWMISGTQIPEEILHKCFRTWPSHLKKMSPLYLVQCRIHASDETRICSPTTSCFVTWHLKFQTSNITAIVKSDHLCVYICLNLFLKPVNRTAHYTVLEFSSLSNCCKMGCVHRSWLTHKSHFLVATTALYIK